MQDYVFHALSESGAPGVVSMTAFEDSAAAIRHGLTSAFPNGCDIWRGGRLIGRVWRPAESEAPAPAAATASTAQVV